MNNQITANDLKMKGISAVKPFAQKGLETIVKVRGKDEYVILTVAAFNHFRECELTAALMESEQDLKSGKFHKGSIKDHLKRIEHD